MEAACRPAIVHLIGIGEGVDDLKVFDKKEFVNSLFSKEDIDK